MSALPRWGLRGPRPSGGVSGGVHLNPVLRRELLERWRGRRATTILTVYLTLLGGILYLLYRAAVAILRAEAQWNVGAGLAFSGPSLGRFLFDGLLFSVLLLVLFVTPGYAAAQLSGERERRTLPLLQITLLKPRQIVAGKLAASLAWLTLLVVAAVPLAAATFFLGGVALTDLLRGTVFILVVAVSVAAVGLGLSSMVKRTTASVVLTYAVVLALVFGTAFVAIIEAVAMSSSNQVHTPVALYGNPFLGLADASGTTDPGSGNMTLPSPLALIAAALPDSEAMRMTRAAGPEAVVLGDPGGPVNEAPVWLWVSALYLSLGALGVIVATRKLRTARVSARRQPVVGAPAGEKAVSQPADGSRGRAHGSGP